MKDETRHAIAMLLVSVSAAVAWLALDASSEDDTLLVWPAGVFVLLVILLLVGLSAYAVAKTRIASAPNEAMAAFEWIWIAVVVPAGLLLAIPLVVAGKFPEEWVSGGDAGLVLRAVLAYVVVDVIKLLALDGKWVSGRMERSAKKLVTSGFSDSEFEELSDKWLALHSDTWQGGWGREARGRRASALARSGD